MRAGVSEYLSNLSQGYFDWLIDRGPEYFELEALMRVKQDSINKQTSGKYKPTF